MMAFLDLANVRTARSIVFLLLLTNVSASDSQMSASNYRSRRSSPIFKAQDLVERRQLAAPSPATVVSGNAAPAPSPSTPLPPPPAPRPSTPLPPPPPSDKRPALITPSADSPGGDLPPKDLNAPPPPLPGSRNSPLAAPISSPDSLSAKQSNTAVILGVALGVVVVLLVSVSAAAFFRPDLLPCCNGRSSRLTQYERHVPT